MRLDAPQPKPPVESATPMINVVFLLLIFFLMTATIAPPAPFEVDPPRAEAEPASTETPDTLHLAADGRMAFGEARGEAALDAAAAAVGGAGQGASPLSLRADAGMEAAALARVLTRLGERGVARADIVVSGR
ncbi:ExbD/TolR family protein [Albimonas pacifica]|uniref:Outer membrane transport energization protein ExbD n=1 Tax=Albimonas pacifica TaxID=1114924 RepID=A0A1I3I0P4_9RHOB|nr:biopolymer transporter ExbD [Albimonas pacifica]SFI41578.1 outer membrane transport energization protein ExbD [Albimonas pacifica]